MVSQDWGVYCSAVAVAWVLYFRGFGNRDGRIFFYILLIGVPLQVGLVGFVLSEIIHLIRYFIVY